MSKSSTRRVGVRELRQNASKLVRRVAKGETIEITHRGELVALLTPVPEGGYERLVASGEIEPSRGDWRELEPIRLKGGAAAVSAALARLRENER